MRKGLGWSLVAGLSIAASTAAFAVVDGSFDDTDWRVIGTSLGFAVFTATGAAGGQLRARRATPSLQLLGTATAVVAAVAFLTLLWAIWGDLNDGSTWQVWGAAALLSLGTSHASLVLSAQRRSDSPAVRLLERVSLSTGSIDTSIAVLVVAEVVDDGPVTLFALLLIALVLSTALTPIVRRLTSEREAGDPAAELLAIATRLDALAETAGPRSGDLRRHADGLRASAKQLSQRV